MAFGDVMNKLFGTTPIAPPIQQIQIVPAPGANNPSGVNQPGVAFPGSDPQNPMVPAGTADPQTTPLDAFSTLWETPKVDPNAPPSDPNNYFATLDPAKVMESAKKVNFANQQVTPEMLAEVAKGGPDAVKVMMQLINQSSQAVYGQSALATASIVQKALDAQREQFQKQLPGILKNQLVSDSLATENPIFTNPALQPMVDMVRQQVLQKFPTATQAETKQQIVSFFNAMQGELQPKPTVSAKQKAADGMDWDSWVSQ
jgi:hypothetical protein